MMIEKRSELTKVQIAFALIFISLWIMVSFPLALFVLGFMILLKEIVTFIHKSDFR